MCATKNTAQGDCLDSKAQDFPICMKSHPILTLYHMQQLAKLLHDLQDSQKKKSIQKRLDNDGYQDPLRKTQLWG